MSSGRDENISGIIMSGLIELNKSAMKGITDIMYFTHEWDGKFNLRLLR
jgi:hypothetical protein